MTIIQGNSEVVCKIMIICKLKYDDLRNKINPFYTQFISIKFYSLFIINANFYHLISLQSLFLNTPIYSYFNNRYDVHSKCHNFYIMIFLNAILTKESPIMRVYLDNILLFSIFKPWPVFV